jgi:hypothetical protein
LTNSIIPVAQALIPNNGTTYNAAGRIEGLGKPN